MSFFKKDTGRQVNLIIDFGNGSVAGALVLFNKNSPPQILYTKRLPLSVSRRVHIKKLSVGAFSILEELVKDIATKGLSRMRSLGVKERVSHTFCVLSSPWFASKTKILQIENAQPIFITPGFIKSLLEKERGIFQNEIKDGNNLEIVEEKIVEVRLNGYPTTDPYHKKARHIELAIFLSLTQAAVIRSIEKIVGRFFYAKDMVLHTYPFVAHRVIDEVLHAEEDFIFVDVSAEITEVSYVQKHILVETSTFPIGHNAMVRSVAEKLSVTPDIAASFVNVYSSGDSEKDASNRVEAAYKKVKDEWIANFLRVVSGSVREKLPAKIFITIDKEAAPFFVNWAKESLSVAQKSVIDFRGIPVVELREENLSQFVSFDKDARRDPFIALESIFFHLL